MIEYREHTMHREPSMTLTTITTMTVWLSGTLSNEQNVFERLKAELSQAYAAPESNYHPLTAADVISRNRT